MSRVAKPLMQRRPRLWASSSPLTFYDLVTLDADHDAAARTAEAANALVPVINGNDRLTFPEILAADEGTKTEQAG